MRQQANRGHGVGGATAGIGKKVDEKWPVFFFFRCYNFNCWMFWPSQHIISIYCNPGCSYSNSLFSVSSLGNKAYHANQFLFKRRLVSKKLKMKLYCSIIRPIVTYDCETWVLKETTKNKLMVLERKVLRKIFGPIKERVSTWRIKTSDELDKLIIHKNIINYTKVQRLSWFGDLYRMSEDRMVKKYVNGNRC